MICSFAFLFFFFSFAGQFELDNLRKDFNKINKEVARLKIVCPLSLFFCFAFSYCKFFFFVFPAIDLNCVDVWKSGGDASDMIRNTDENKQLTAQKEIEVNEAKAVLFAKLESVGNLVHDSVPIDNDEVALD